MIKFYDTCSLLNLQEKLFQDGAKFAVSSISFEELEHIKTSASKDEETKYRARKVTKMLMQNEDMFDVFLYEDKTFKDFFVTNNNDKKIVLSAIKYGRQVNNKVIFITDDISCYNIAKARFDHLNKKEKELKFFVQYGSNTRGEEEIYTGYKEVFLDENMLASFYNDLYDNNYKHNFLTNEYLIIKDAKTKETIDRYKFDGMNFDRVNFPIFNTKMFGKIKPKDEFQWCAMDSLVNNQLTLLGGKPGSGKTMLSLGYLFTLLEKGEIDKIVIFCNPVGAKDAARLGFYPGTVLEKLLSTQAGNVLSSKIGAIMIEELVRDSKLDIIPAVDARGYEVPPYSGCYIMEAQNLTSDLLRMLLQRTAKDTKIIIDGDRFEQTDMAVYEMNNGMKKVSDIFKGYELYGQVDLKNIYRSEIANIAEKMKG